MIRVYLVHKLDSEKFLFRKWRKWWSFQLPLNEENNKSYNNGMLEQPQGISVRLAETVDAIDFRALEFSKGGCEFRLTRVDL